MNDSTVHALTLTSLEMAGRLGLAVAMSIFVGLAFAEIYKHDEQNVPGGIRTFPMLTLGGMLLYLVDSSHALGFLGGLLGLSAWLYAYVSARSVATPPVAVSLMVPATNVLAYAMGPIAISQPPWILVSVSVAAVLLLGQREYMHRLVGAIPQNELVTAGKFLILAGVVYPLVPHDPVVSWIPITPYQVWLAVLAVSTLSYISYLLQRYLPSRGDTLLPAILGGAYSSTISTVVLARQQRELSATRPEISAGIVAATAVMYIRLEGIIFAFDRSLAVMMLPLLVASMVVGAALAAYEWSKAEKGRVPTASTLRSTNPLALGSAMIFAGLFVGVSVLAAWVSAHLGARGILGLAAIAGVTDIDPFVLNLVQGGVPGISKTILGAAILIAVTGNNVLKACYAVGFSGGQCRRAALELVFLGLINLVGVVILLQAA